MSSWATLSYSNNATFGERVFVNMPWRAHTERSNKLTAWIAPVLGREDEPGAWRFRARSGKNDLPESQTTELLAGVFTLLAGHGFTPETISFSTLSAIAQRPQHHISTEHREAAKQHIARQKQMDLDPSHPFERGLS
ncbi:hypothetical protein [Pseudophaeobacter sp. 1A09344]|uniref:hypothetical protein n=1 Tax=Pseudophaeobacter sp. 1A09344 TaxID=3098144 RepID=UPI0034D65FE0